MFTCGTGNFAHMDHDEPLSPAPSTPKGSSSKLKKHSNKNPYSARGLDKFSMVLAELETRREKIIAKTGAQGVAMIKFMCDNSKQDWVPIIVRPKENKAPGQAAELKKLPAPAEAKKVDEQQAISKKKVKEEKEEAWSLSFLRWRESYCWPLVIVLILLCLVMFGRVFAICCTSVWWYMAPSMMERCVKKKMVKRFGAKGIKELASPRASGNEKKLG